MKRADEDRGAVTITVGGRSYCSIGHAAATLRVTTAHVRRLVRSGRLASTRADGRAWVLGEAVRQYQRERGPWPLWGVYGGKQEAVEQGLIKPAQLELEIANGSKAA